MVKNVVLILEYGDGIMGYVVYVMLVNKYNDLDITVFGTMEEKLKMFKKAKTKLVREPCKVNIKPIKYLVEVNVDTIE